MSAKRDKLSKLRKVDDGEEEGQNVDEVQSTKQRNLHEYDKNDIDSDDDEEEEEE